MPGNRRAGNQCRRAAIFKTTAYSSGCFFSFAHPPVFRISRIWLSVRFDIVALSFWRFASRCASHGCNIAFVYGKVNRIPCNSESFFKINSPPHDGLKSVAVRTAAILRLEFGVALRRSARAELSADRAQPITWHLMPRRRLARSAIALLRVSWRL